MSEPFVIRDDGLEVVSELECRREMYGVQAAHHVRIEMAVGGLVSGLAAAHRAPHETATTTGTVITGGKCGKSPTYGRAAFVVDGSHHTARVDCNTHKGQQVTVNYDPADPSRNNDSENYVHNFVVAGVGLLLAVIVAARGIPALARERRRSGSGGHRSP